MKLLRDMLGFNPGDQQYDEEGAVTDRSGGVPQRDRVVQGLRALAGAQSDMGRLFARLRQMHPTDAAAIVEILTAEGRGTPISPARLAERIGLTTGATSTLLNRMEDAGHVLRTREHSDRRVVTLHSTPAIHETFDAFFAPLADRLREAMSGYSTDELDLVEDVVERLRTTMDAYTTTVRDTTHVP